MELYDEINSYFHLPNAFEDWTEYKKSLTNFIIEQTDYISLPLCFTSDMPTESNKPTLLIVGAGACNDLDLSLLHSHFQEITLLDYDYDLLQSALTNYHLTQSTQMKLCVESINGITQEHNQFLCKQLQDFLQLQKLSNMPMTQESFDAFAYSVLHALLQTITDYKIPFEKQSYDYVCCIGVHSQLTSMLSYIYHAFDVNMEHRYQTWKDKTSNAFETLLKQYNTDFIPRFHDTLLDCTRKKLFIGYETGRTTFQNIKSSPVSTPIEGAYQCQCDLAKRNLTYKTTNLLWPFCKKNDIYYEMQIMAIQTT